jgi:hypothetical protein
MTNRRKPDGLEEFQKLIQPLSKVPKKELEKQVAKYKQRKAVKKKRKS